MGAQVLSRVQAEKVLIDKATADDAFRAALLSNPKAAIRGVLGMDLPSELTITVIEETPRSVVLVLPPRAADGVLNDADLRGVVGGATPSGDFFEKSGAGELDEKLAQKSAEMK